MPSSRRTLREGLGARAAIPFGTSTTSRGAMPSNSIIRRRSSAEQAMSTSLPRAMRCRSRSRRRREPLKAQPCSWATTTGTPVRRPSTTAHTLEPSRCPWMICTFPLRRRRTSGRQAATSQVPLRARPRNWTPAASAAARSRAGESRAPARAPDRSSATRREWSRNVPGRAAWPDRRPGARPAVDQTVDQHVPRRGGCCSHRGRSGARVTSRSQCTGPSLHDDDLLRPGRERSRRGQYLGAIRVPLVVVLVMLDCCAAGRPLAMRAATYEEPRRAAVQRTARGPPDLPRQRRRATLANRRGASQTRGWCRCSPRAAQEERPVAAVVILRRRREDQVQPLGQSNNPQC